MAKQLHAPDYESKLQVHVYARMHDTNLKRHLGANIAVYSRKKKLRQPSFVYLN